MVGTQPVPSDLFLTLFPNSCSSWDFRRPDGSQLCFLLLIVATAQELGRRQSVQVGGFNCEEVMGLPVAPAWKTAQPKAGLSSREQDRKLQAPGHRGNVCFLRCLQTPANKVGRGWAGLFMPSLGPASLGRRMRGREGPGGVLQRRSSTWRP